MTLSVMFFLLILFGLGSLISVARKAVTWLDFMMMGGFGFLAGLQLMSVMK